MKKSLFIFTLMCLGAVFAQAQPGDVVDKIAERMQVIPREAQVRIGKLDNGLTYYIRHNAKPENQAEFYIVHHVGAIQEDTAQIGLAHFLEHMAFNGTKNFPDKGIINYLETVGVKFGANLNAGTGQEQTAYTMSSVPLLREGIVDSCLLILHDWSYFITLDSLEIEKERGVIVEELRTHNNADFRTSEALFPTIYNNSRYAWRNIIGNEAALRSFKRQELVDFYHRWYRTDLQAVIVVGDFDVDKMEAKVRAVMSDIPAVKNPVPKEMIEIPDNVAPLVGIATDPETTGTAVSMYIKHEPIPLSLRDRVPIAQVGIMKNMISTMANRRLGEITRKPAAPFISAGIAQGALTETCDVVLASAEARDGEAASAFEALYTEVERIRRHGFTQGELERVQSDMMRAARRRYDNRDDRRSDEFANMYRNNFIRNTPIPDAQFKWEMDSTIIADVNLTVINEFCKELFIDQNQELTLTAPEKEGAAVPSANDLKGVIGKVGVMDIAAWEDDVVIEPLIKTELRPGKVVKEETDKLGDTVLTLANGLEVVIRKTDFKADELLVRVNMQRGLSILSDEEYPSGEMLESIVPMSGVDRFTASQLEKQLSGKAVRVTPMIGDYENGFSCNCSPKDLETLLQLLHLYFTSPRFDQGDFDVTMDRYASALANAGMSPDYLMSRRLQNTLYGNNIRRQAISAERLQLANFQLAQQAWHKLYVNPVGFKYTLVGNIDIETAKPLIEKYLGSFPPTRIASPGWRDDKADPVKGVVEDRFTVPMQAPKTTVYTVYSGELPYTMENSMRLSILKQVLDMRYLESVREEKGGTYGVGVRPSLTDLPEGGYMLSIAFDTDPAMADELMAIIPAELEKIAEQGPLATDMAKIREYMAKQRQDNLKMNPAWLNYVDTFHVSGVDITSGYEAALESMTADKIRELAAKIVADGNMVRVVMSPQ